MKRKKFSCLILTVALIFSLACSSAFAITVDDVKNGPNAIAIIEFDNPECVALKDIESLSVRITKPGTNIDISIPVEKVVEDGEVVDVWLSSSSEKLEDAVLEQLKEIQGNVNLGNYNSNPEALLTELEKMMTNFTVELVGGPKGHFETDSTAFVVTNEIVTQVTALVKDSLAEEGYTFTTYAQLLKDLGLDSSLGQLLELTSEEQAQLEETLTNIDAIISYYESTDFTGILIADVYVECDCPRTTSFTIEHRYYTEKGGKYTLVGNAYEGEYDDIFESYYLLGMSGDKIYAKDYVKPTFKNQTYEYVGSYDVDYVDEYGYAEISNCDSFAIGEDTYGLVLRYVIHEDSAAADSFTSPKTSDNSCLACYALLLLLAITGIGLIAAKKTN